MAEGEERTTLQFLKCEIPLLFLKVWGKVGKGPHCSSWSVDRLVLSLKCCSWGRGGGETHWRSSSATSELLFLTCCFWGWMRGRTILEEQHLRNLSVVLAPPPSPPSAPWRNNSWGLALEALYLRTHTDLGAPTFLYVARECN